MSRAGPTQRLRWRSDFDKSVVIGSFERRGWTRAGDSTNWNVYWANVHNAKLLFNPEYSGRLQDDQMVNHFPNHYELTRKDMMVKNIKRYKKEKEKERDNLQNASLFGGGGDSSVQGLGGVGADLDELDFVPTTFSLPADYSLFVEEFRRCPNLVWIVKPAARARGLGIFLVNKLSQVKKWATLHRWPQAQQRDLYIVSRYIENPLLVGGKKFDLRLYVLVQSYRPLRVWLYKRGFARFCNVKYSMDMSELDNLMAHLTNVAIQKHGEEYDERNGGKWDIGKLRLWLESTRGAETTDRLFSRIDSIIIHSLKAVQGVIINDRHCFELYGYDIIIDDALKPWLIETNASPSLSTTTPSDRKLKTNLLRDTMEVVVDPNREFPSPVSDDKRHRVGDFELLYDEADDRDRTLSARRVAEDPRRSSRMRKAGSARASVRSAVSMRS